MPIEVLKKCPIKEEAEIITPFKVGDRVKCIADYDGKRSAINKCGKVVHITEFRVGVMFDEPIQGHSCGGHTKDGYGWYFPKMAGFLIPHGDDSEKIIIYNDKDGVIHAKYINETTRTCKVVKAQTHGEDRYNFFTGAKVALQKLGKKCNSESKVIMTKQQLEALLSNIEVI